MTKIKTIKFMQHYHMPCQTLQLLTADVRNINIRAQLFKGWITLPDNKTYCTIYQIKIYPADSDIHPLNK